MNHEDQDAMEIEGIDISDPDAICNVILQRVRYATLNSVSVDFSESKRS